MKRLIIVVCVMVACAAVADGHKDPLMVTIKIDGTGVMCLAESVVTLDQLTTIMSNVVTEYGVAPPVHIDAATNAPFESVWGAIESCRRHGIWRFALIGPPEEEDGNAMPLKFFAPFPPDGQKHKGLVITNFSRTVRIELDGNSLRIQGRAVTDKEISATLSKLSALDRHMSFIIEPQGRKILAGQIVDLMRQLRDAGSHQLSIMSGTENAQHRARGDAQ